MLKHLIVKTHPIANTKNIVFFDDYRITVLDTGLFRIEQAEGRRFNDRATQHIWFRNMPPQSFEVTEGNNEISIKTARATLTVNKDMKKSRILLDGVTLQLENNENLLGTYRTLDCFDGIYSIRNSKRLQLENGVCSRNGVAIINDTEALILTDDGRLTPPSNDTFDIYVFAYGNEYREAVRALYMICGSTPMLPRFAFGNWWSRFHAYTDEEYLHLMDQFAEQGIPLTVATLDIDWHYSDNVDEDKQISAQGKNTLDRGTLETPENKRIGWTGYSWNTKLFPDYRTFLSELHKRDLKVTLNLHPASGIRYYEDMYKEMAVAMGIDPITEKAVPFNISDPHFVEEYFKILHHPYEKDGVDFWWIDWQQGTTTEMDGLDPLWALNHYHYLDNGKDHRYPLIMSRYAGIGSHRYPIGFSGDTSISWETLSLLPYFTATAANCGYTWWGHDIGGHHLGVKDDELYLRFLQYGVFNPVNRAHSTSSELISKEPWEYENGIGELAKKMLVLRHRMIPFLYTCNYLTHAEGIALCEPLYYQYPEYEESYGFKNEYMFGRDLLVAPITHHTTENGLCELPVFLPEGTWTDIFTNEVYRIGKGGRTFTAVRSLDSIPVFAKAGSVLPLSNDEGNGCENPRCLEAKIYNGNGEFSLYEDNGDASVFTSFTLTEKECTQKVTVTVNGDTSVIPVSRSLKLTFPNIVIRHTADSVLDLHRSAPTISVLKNGSPCHARINVYSEVSVTIESFDPTAAYEISVYAEPLDELIEAKRSIIKVLKKVQGDFTDRNNILKKVSYYTELERILGYIMLSGLKTIEKKRLTELFLDN